MQLAANLTAPADAPSRFDVSLDVNAPVVRTPWGGARDVQLAASLTTSRRAHNFDSTWAWWTNLQPYRLAWTMRLTQLQSEKLNADPVVCGGLWQAPELAVTNLSAALGGGQLDAQARLNVATREFTFTNSSCFDVHAVAALLTEKTRERLAEFSWTQPPSLRAGGSLILPAWTNRQRDWRGEVQPTIRLDGELAFTNGTAFGAKIDSACTHFHYSNLVWRLPDLAIAQAKTRLELAGGEDDATKNYHWHIRGAFDPETLRPFLTASNAARGLSHFTFTEPATLDLDVRGRLYDYDSIDAAGRVALTNFTIRGQAADSVVSGFQYSNRVVEFFSPRLWRAGGTQTMTADRITLDFNAQRIWFVNGFSTADPEAVARAIGPKTGRTLEPYQFLEPPTVRVNGCAPLRGTDGADLSFDIIKGAPFQWLKLKTPYVTGTVHWQGQTLILTNVAAGFYGGSGKGSANFDFRAPHEGADYQFAVNVTNVNLHLLAADLLSSTNHLEGTLNGQPRRHARRFAGLADLGRFRPCEPARRAALGHSGFWHSVAGVEHRLARPGQQPRDGGFREICHHQRRDLFRLAGYPLDDDAVAIRRHGGFAGERERTSDRTVAAQHVGGRAAGEHGTVAGEQIVRISRHRHTEKSEERTGFLHSQISAAAAAPNPEFGGTVPRRRFFLQFTAGEMIRIPAGNWHCLAGCVTAKPPGKSATGNLWPADR